MDESWTGRHNIIIKGWVRNGKCTCTVTQAQRVAHETACNSCGCLGAVLGGEQPCGQKRGTENEEQVLIHKVSTNRID